MTDADDRALRFHAPGVELAGSLVPWDTEVIGAPVVAIDRIAVAPDVPPASLRAALGALDAWLERTGALLASCRLPSADLRASMLLEEAGFRFIETVYDPVLAPLPADPTVPPGIALRPAEPADLVALEAIAGEAFATGRHALDHRLDPRIAGRRYRRWLRTSLDDPAREVLVAREEEAVVGLFVVERVADGAVRWQLTAIAAGARGRGVGRRVWGAMIARHAADGLTRIETTVSGHNLPVLGLYATLGFRLTAPRATFHRVRA